VAPRCGVLLVRHPEQLLAMLSNAVVQLQKFVPARTVDWLDAMTRLAPQATSIEEMRTLGQLLAWRVGVAHFRVSALEASRRLPEALALAAFDLPADGQWRSVCEAMLADPWHGSPPAGAGIMFGAFTGFGGDFAEPPALAAADEGFWVRSGERYFLLVADRYGALLHGASAEEFSHAAQAAALPPHVALSDKRLTLGGRTLDLDLPAGSIVITCNAHTVAVSSPYTHAIRLLPLR
jgi:hypothetical protein